PGGAVGGEVRRRVDQWGVRLEKPAEGIRATVIGASQYTTQVSGSTIFVSPLGTLPLRNIPVIAPQLPLDHETIGASGIAEAIKAVLSRLDLTEPDGPVAIFVPWRGSAGVPRLPPALPGGLRGVARAGAHDPPAG